MKNALKKTKKTTKAKKKDEKLFCMLEKFLLSSNLNTFH